MSYTLFPCPMGCSKPCYSLMPNYVSPSPQLKEKELLPQPASLLAPSWLLFRGAESPTRTARDTAQTLTHRVDVQRVHSEVIGVHVQAVEHLPQGNLPAMLLRHNSVGLRLIRVLDEAQQVLLVHTGRCVDVRVHLQHSTRQPVSRATSPGHRS